MLYEKIKVKIKDSTDIEQNETVEGITIEEKIALMLENNEPISDAVPLHYTERKEGVKAEFNIRTDRFDLALEKMDYVTKTNIAKRAERLKKTENTEETNDNDNVA